MDRNVRVVLSCLCFAGLFATLASGEEMVDNPAYPMWANFQVGSMAEYKSSSEMMGQVTESTMIYTLLENTAEKCVVEVRMSTMAAGQKYDPPATTMEIEAKLAKQPIQVPENGSDVKPEITEGTETVEIAGRSIETKWTQMVTRAGTSTTTSKTWMSDDVPGQTVRMLTTIEGDYKMKSEMVLVSLKAEKN